MSISLQKIVENFNIDSKNKELFKSEIFRSLCTLQILSNENFKSGLDTINLKIADQCKLELSKIFIDHGVYNTNIGFRFVDGISINQSIYSSFPPNPENNNYGKISSIPSLIYTFTPIDLLHRRYKDVSLDLIKQVETIQQEIQGIISEVNRTFYNQGLSSLQSILSLHDAYLDKTDGFLIKIDLESCLDIDQITLRLKDVQEEFKILPISEIMLAQYYSDYISLKYENPSFLALCNTEDLPKNNLFISIYNMKNSTAPLHYLESIFNFLISEISKNSLNNIDDFTLFNSSINSSYFYLKVESTV